MTQAVTKLPSGRWPRRATVRAHPQKTRRTLSGPEHQPTRIPKVRWERFLWPSIAVSLALLALPQAGFIWLSFHEDLGLGQVRDEFTLINYWRVVTDPFYLHAMWLTVYLSAFTVAVVVVFGFPTAYALARMTPWISAVLISLILATSLITVVIKLMGLSIILGPSGFINHLLLGAGILSTPVHLINNQIGVLIGLVQYTLPLFVMLMFSVIQTVPVTLEEAAEIHGASRISIYKRIVIPLVKPGLVAGALICFNMSMGAFTSAVLLGGGRVRTLPVLIQQKIIQSNEYGLGAALSTVLLLFVFAINVGIGIISTRQERP
jgi:putative spermidine/putrescine transport system permease protein